MITCKKCGGHTPQGYSYCTICGTILDGMKEQKVIPLSDYNDLCRELEGKKSILDDLRKQGYAPSGFKLMSESEYNSLLNSQNQLSKILNDGYAPSGKRLIDESEYTNLIAAGTKKSSFFRLFAFLFCIVLAGYLGWMYFASPSSATSSNKEEMAEQLSLPDDLTGYYIVREKEGEKGEGIAAKVLHEEGQYSLSVYSSYITRKYFFAYNKETGKLSSEELGNGKVEYFGNIKQLKLSFEGWILVK